MTDLKPREELLRLTEALERSGRQLNAKPTNAHPLRDLQELAEPFQYDSSDSNIRFVAFFIFTFVDDLFYNLAGDIPYSAEFNQIQNKAIASVGSELEGLAQVLRDERFEHVYPILRDLTVSYLDALSEAQSSESGILAGSSRP